MSDDVAAWERLAEQIDGLSIEGHDRDCARAIVNQARLHGGHGGALTTTQAIHLLQIGRRSAGDLLADAEQRGRVAALREAAEDGELAEILAREENAAYIGGSTRGLNAYEAVATARGWLRERADREEAQP